MQSVNSAKVLNITPLFLSSARYVLSSAPAPSSVIVDSQVCTHHYNHINLTSAFNF